MLQYTGNTEVLDLNIFDVDSTLIADKTKKSFERAKKLKDPNATPARRGNWILAILAAAGVLAVILTYLFAQIRLSEVRSETLAAQIRLEETRQENIQLNTALEGMVTPAIIEEFAAENGLMREQTSQVTHITVNIENLIEITEIEESDFLSRLNLSFNEILEFLSFR